MDESPASAPTLPPPPKPRRPMMGVLFRAPEQPETTPAPGETPPPSPSDSPPPLDGSASASASQPDEPPVLDESGQPSSGTSTRRRPKAIKPVDRDSLETIAVSAVSGAGEIAHQRLAHDPHEVYFEAWKVQDHEAEQIGVPLASLAARHSNGVASMANPDVSDAVTALIGVGVYIARQLKIRSLIRDRRRASEASGLQVAPPPDAEVA